MASAFGHILALSASTFGSAFLIFLTQLILVRLVPIGEYGQFVALLALINLLTPFSTYGVGFFWLRAFGEEGWGGFRWIGPSVRLMALTCGAMALVLAGYTASRNVATDHLLAIGLAVPILIGQVFVETTSARLQLEERFGVLAFWQSLTQAGRFCVAAGLFATHLYGVTAPLAGYAILGAALGFVGIASIRQMLQGQIALAGHGTRLRPGISSAAEPSLLSLVREATPYCFWTVFYLLYFQSVIILLELLVGRSAAAIYNVAFQVIYAAHLVPAIYTKYLFGKIFRWSEHDPEKFLAAFHVSVLGMLAIGSVTMVAVVILSPILVPVLFGQAYAAASPIIVALSVTIPIRFVQTAYGSLFFSKEKMKWQVIYSGVAACFCLALNVVLLPRYGITGAEVTSIATESLLLLLYLRAVGRFMEGVQLSQTFRLGTLRRALITLSSAPAE